MNHSFPLEMQRLLFGEINPSGKMSFSFPVTENDTWIQTPTQYPGVPFGDVTFTEGVFMGYRWYDQQNKDPLFSFGHGLSYASFSYSNLQVKWRITVKGARRLDVIYRYR